MLAGLVSKEAHDGRPEMAELEPEHGAHPQHLHHDRRGSEGRRRNIPLDEKTDRKDTKMKELTPFRHSVVFSRFSGRFRLRRLSGAGC